MNNSRLEEMRELNDLTKKKFAEILGVSDSIYARWENERDAIPTKRLYQIANYFEINIDYLLGFTDVKISIKSDDEINSEIVATRVREIRQDFNESLRDFSKRLNTSNSTWSAYETGKVLILESFLVEVCKFGNYSADWILGRTNKKYLND